jgi:hypothetical protein
MGWREALRNLCSMQITRTRQSTNRYRARLLKVNGLAPVVIKFLYVFLYLFIWWHFRFSRRRVWIWFLDCFGVFSHRNWAMFQMWSVPPSATSTSETHSFLRNYAMQHNWRQPYLFTYLLVVYIMMMSIFIHIYLVVQWYIRIIPRNPLFALRSVTSPTSVLCYIATSLLFIQHIITVSHSY